jgi:hypothetical protein
MARWYHFIGSTGPASRFVIGPASGLGIGLVSGFLLMAAAALPAPLNASKANGSPETAPETALETTENLLAHLADGAYQFCTEPAPTDWRDGAGACLNVVKEGTILDGYYGYPHSESFVCLQGEVSENELHGQGFSISWPDHPWSNIPQTAFIWDEEGRLSLAEASVTRHEGNVSWITFRQADLNMQALYLYPSARMNPPAQVCSFRHARFN